MENNLGSDNLKFKWKKKSIVDTLFFLQVDFTNISQGRKKNILKSLACNCFHFIVKSNDQPEWKRNTMFLVHDADFPLFSKGQVP